MNRRVLLVMAGILFIFGGSRLSFAMELGGHDSGQQAAQAHSGHEQGAIKTAEQTTSEKAVNIGNKICPVSGEKISEAGESGMKPATYEYKGKIYNFCCPSCIKDFKKDPEKYVKKVEKELQASRNKEILK